MDSLEEIRDLVTSAGGIFNGIWETPEGRFATVTDPRTLSTALTPVAGISLSSIKSALDRVSRQFSTSSPDDATGSAAKAKGATGYPVAPCHWSG